MVDRSVVARVVVIVACLGLGGMAVSSLLPRPVDGGWLAPGVQLSYKGSVTWTTGEGGNSSHSGGLMWSVVVVNGSGVFVNVTLYYHFMFGHYIVATAWEPWQVVLSAGTEASAFWCFGFGGDTLVDCFNASPHPVAWLAPSPEGWSLRQRTVRARAVWGGDYVDCTFDVSRGLLVALGYAYGAGTARRWVSVELDAPPMDLGPSRVNEEAVVWAGVALLGVGVGLVVVWCGRAVLRRARRRRSLT